MNQHDRLYLLVLCFTWIFVPVLLCTWFLGGVCLIFAFLCTSTFGRWVPAAPEKGQLIIGRWINLVLYTYVEECLSNGIKPFLPVPGAKVPPGDSSGLPAPIPPQEPADDVAKEYLHSKRHKCFVAAALATRDKLLQETSTLVSF